MSETMDRGHFSLVGFVFQLLGSGVEAIEVYEEPDNPDEPSSLLVLERFGQDSAVLGGGPRRNRLNQYKFTSTDDHLAPSDIRKILQRFVASTAEMGESIDHIGFVLTTNRNWSPTAEELWGVRENEKLTDDEKQREIERRLELTTQDGLEGVPEMARVFRSLELRKCKLADFEASYRCEAAAFGVLPGEMPQRIDEVLGLLLRNSGTSGRRVVHPTEFYTALTGIIDPIRLMADTSRQMRLAKLANFRGLETEGRPTQPRPMVDSIAMATMTFPLVVVVGDGGSGKSVAICDAVERCCRDHNLPPGFAYLGKAIGANSIAVMDEIAAWRNQPQQQDGQNLPRSIARLAVAFPEKPHLVIYADGIDEKAGYEALPNQSDEFLRASISKAVEQFRENGAWEVGVVVTCRQLSDLDDLGLGAFLVEAETYKDINLGEFSFEEIEELAGRLTDKQAGERISAHISLQHNSTATNASPAVSSVASDSFRLIRHPVLWGAFTQLSPEEQHQFLDGDAIARLAELYLHWFRRKAAKRIPQLEQDACLAALTAAARSFSGGSTETGGYRNSWREPCIAAGCTRMNAQLLFNEAITAGIIRIVEERDRVWRWEHPWLCNYLQTLD